MTPVERFAADYFVTERLSPDRQAFVLRALRMFSEHAGRPVEQLADADLQAFLVYLMGEGLAPNTVRKFNHAIKPFYRWAWRARILDADVYMRIREVANPRGATGEAAPRPYKRTEIARFWQELDERFPPAPPERLRRFRDGRARYRRVWMHATNLQIRAIVSFALFGGLRRFEIRELDLADMHPDNEFIVVRGKTVVHDEPKLREVPYTERGRELVWDWLDFRTLLSPDHERPWLVLSPQATPNHPTTPSHPAAAMTVNGFDGILRRIGEWEYHRFRHTAATEWLRSGMKIEKVSKLLGHASLQQTLGYAQLLNDDVARDMLRVEGDFMTAVGDRRAA